MFLKLILEILSASALSKMKVSQKKTSKTPQANAREGVSLKKISKDAIKDAILEEFLALQLQNGKKRIAYKAVKDLVKKYRGQGYRYINRHTIYNRLKKQQKTRLPQVVAVSDDDIPKVYNFS